MFTTEKLYDVFKKKISNQEKADRLNISLEEYDDLKKVIYDVLDEEQSNVDKIIIDKLDLRFKGIVSEPVSTEYHEDLDKGTMKITSVVSEEPRSAEEIIILLKIDTSKWKLSQYWNKQKGNKWEISALVTKIKEQEIDLVEVLKTIKLPTYNKITNLLKSKKDPACGVISLQDLHFGKGDDEELEKHIYAAISDLLGKATSNYNLERIIFVIGGDLLNMDTFNDTTTSGTLMKSKSDPVSTYIKAFEAVCVIITLLKQACDDLRVVYIPGNHDRLSSFHLLHAVSQAFVNEKDILFDVRYDERKVQAYGDNMFCFEHGDVSKKNNALVYATEYPIIWGHSRYRRLYTGHYHFKKTTEFISENELNGFTTKILPSLSGTDYWHYHKKFTGSKKAAVLEVNDKTKGMVAEYIHTI